MEYCQATRSDPVEVEIPSQSADGPYRLCQAAADRLQAYCLRPLEWYNLAVIHGPFEVYLHDDFYDEDGTAGQPKEEVVDPELFPAPTLDDVVGDLSLLLDFTGTRWHLDEDLVAALKTQDPERLLSALIERHRRTKNRWFHDRYNAICGAVLGRRAESWIRSQLSSAAPNNRLDILAVAGACLPSTDAISIAFSSLEALPQRELASRAYWVLAQFHDPQVLDWIETHLSEQVTSEWGDLAAVTGLHWDRVVSWLKRGRPFALAALDALCACDSPRPNQSILIQQASPKLLSHQSFDAMAAVLRDYASRDPAPRVKKAVEHILSRLPAICGEKQ